MIKKIGLSVLLFALINNTLYAQTNLSKSDFVKLDFKILASNKNKIASKDTSLVPAYHQLLKDADESLQYLPVSVMDKKELPPSGNKHDYMSLAPYWWPDASKPNGKPYIRKDGEVNPEVTNYPDKENMPKLCQNVYILSLAYYFSGQEKYATHAVALIKGWFLDTATSMNPNLNFGQAVKGITEGRAEGIIEVRHFIFLIDGVELLKKSPGFKKQDQTELTKWFTSFLGWLQNSEIGKDERNAKNNHGVWYDATCLSIANYIRDLSLAETIVKSAANRLDLQMDDKGNFPLELERTTSLHYTVFVLDAFTVIAQLSKNTTTDFWTLQTKTKKSLRKGYETIFPYLTGHVEWAYPQIKKFSMSNSYQLLLRGATKYNCNACLETIKKIEGKKYESLLLNLL